MFSSRTKKAALRFIVFETNPLWRVTLQELLTGAGHSVQFSDLETLPERIQEEQGADWVLLALGPEEEENREVIEELLDLAREYPFRLALLQEPEREGQALPFPTEMPILTHPPALEQLARLWNPPSSPREGEKMGSISAPVTPSCAGLEKGAEGEDTPPAVPLASQDQGQSPPVGIPQEEGFLREERARLEEELESDKVMLYKDLLLYVYRSIRRVQQELLPDLQAGQLLLDRVAESVGREPALLLAATDRHQKYFLSAHSANVAILAIRVAQALPLARGEQVRIGLSALLHEIGAVQLPSWLLQEPKRLEQEEIGLIRQRTYRSAQLLGCLGSDYAWLSRTIEQIYEREDGSGWPHGLEGEELLPHSKVLAVADVFEACIHERPYRRPLTGYQSLAEITQEESRWFSESVVRALLRSMTLYPFNEYVELSSREVARVIDVNPSNLARPFVQFLLDGEGRPLKRPRFIDLSRTPHLFISRALPPDSVPQAVLSRKAVPPRRPQA